HRQRMGTGLSGAGIPHDGLRDRHPHATRRVAPGSRHDARRTRAMSTTFRVGITRDILDSRSEPAFGRAALEILDRAPGVEWEYLPEKVRELSAEHGARYDALYVNMARTPAGVVARPDCRLRVVARHGVGYDSVDVPAMTRAGVIVTNTPTAMPRPVA